MRIRGGSADVSYYDLTFLSAPFYADRLPGDGAGRSLRAILPWNQNDIERRQCCPAPPQSQSAAGKQHQFHARQSNLRLPVKCVARRRSEEHPSELQSLMRNTYAVFCLKTKNTSINKKQTTRL